MTKEMNKTQNRKADKTVKYNKKTQQLILVKKTEEMLINYKCHLSLIQMKTKLKQLERGKDFVLGQ